MCITMWLKQNEFWPKAACSLNKTDEGRIGWQTEVWWHGKTEKEGKRAVVQRGSEVEEDNSEREEEGRQIGTGSEGRREREVESESVISEAVLNWALRQDVLYMLMTLPHAHTQTRIRTHTHTHLERALLRFLTKCYCPLLSWWHI